uniref:Uncharacterized protein n=2 Tax=Plectus sambesii TaxID=2011161 RepID=A0A914W2M1_9BILA
MHGSRRRLNRRHRLKSNRSYALTSMDTVDFSVSDVDAPMYSGQRFAAKLMRKRRRAILTGHEKVRVEKQKFKIKWNVFVMSVAFLLLFTAFHGLQNLQTTVNSEEYLGAVSLSVVYLSLAVSSLFLPSYLINRLGCKQAMIVSMAMYTLYMLANFIPRWYALVPASVLVGMAGSCLWAANCIYITETGVRYSHLNIESPNGVIVRFFGYFFMIVHMGQVFGNLISSLMLEKTMHYNQPVDRVEKTCGHFFTGQWNELSETGRENLTRPPQRVYLAVCAIYVCCTIIATLILTLFLNTLHKDEVAKKDAPRFNLDVFRRTLENLRKPKPVLLIPLTIFNGMEQAFIVGEFTKAYVACGLGLSQIGFVMTAFGIADAVCSLVFGPLIKLFGRMPLFIFGAVVDMLMIFTLLVWPFNPGDTAMFYVIACAWGMADGVWNTQLNGFWVALVGQHLEVAFANYRFWESFGLAVAFLLMRFTTTEIFLYILLGSLFLGMIGYFAIEIYDHIIEACAKGRMICIDLYNFYRDSSKQNVPTSMEASLISTQPIQGGRSNPLVLPDFDVSLHI